MSADNDPQPIFQRLDTTSGYPYPLREDVRRALWEVVQGTLIRFSPRELTDGGGSGYANSAQKWPTQPAPNQARTSSTHGSSMGAHSMLSERVEIHNLGEVAIGDHTVLSQDAYVCAGTHDYARPDLPLIRSSIQVGSGVWICAGAFIGPGVRVGNNAVVGARAVDLSTLTCQSPHFTKKRYEVPILRNSSFVVSSFRLA